MTLSSFERDGYIVLKNAMNKKSCRNLIKKTIIPILHKNRIYLRNRNTWKTKIGNRRQGLLLAGDYDEHIIPQTDENFRFPTFFNSKKLLRILDSLHRKKWKYMFLGKEGLGWIHLRFPYYDYIKNGKENCLTDNSFHLDGTYENSYNDTQILPQQSVVLLPFITTVKKNGGGTAVIPGSHKLINDYILRHHYKSNCDVSSKINKIVEDNNDKIVDICGEQGDILIMHPHLVHSSSLADINSNVRITFNIGIES